ncbi:hypothetical protein MKEN_01098700 [Mycena kentingensis (nom. inval.)]|nr:hypothetical protein MKEN_01098700 [Mycena kentingensis (nom. inval.)]
MLDRLPPELCQAIFRFACTDAGTTGRALSLVSTSVRELSSPYKLQSIAIVGRAQILGFAALLERTPDRLRRTRFLYIDGPGSAEEQLEIQTQAFGAWHAARDSLDCLLDRRARGERIRKDVHEVARNRADAAYASGRAQIQRIAQEVADAAYRVMRSVAPALEVLDILLAEYVAAGPVFALVLPNIVDLTARCGFPLNENQHMSTTTLAPCPKLTHLHIVEKADRWHSAARFFASAGIAHFAPAITNLRISGLQQSGEFLNDLEVVLGLREPTAEAAYEFELQLVPKTIQQVVIQPAPPYRGNDWMVAHLSSVLLQNARRLRDQDARVVLLKAKQNSYYDEWLVKADGSRPLWSVDDIDVQPSPKI